MLKTAAAIALSIGLGGLAAAAMAQTAQTAAEPGRVLLVKHDKEDNGRGRKLGHYKNRHRDDEDGSGDDRTRRITRGTTTPMWVVPAPAPYYAPPGYGNSYPPAPYDYYPPPSYYRGY